MTNDTCAQPDCTRPRKGRGLCAMHYNRLRRHGDVTTVLQAKQHATPADAVRAALGRIDESGCWLAKASAVDATTGYARVSYLNRNQLAHRLSYEAHVGLIPEGLQLDHLCRVRHCLAPSHLEPVTCAENIHRSPIAQAALNARKTHCPQGHAYSPENTYVGRLSGRACRTCVLARQSARKAVAA